MSWEREVRYNIVRRREDREYLRGTVQAPIWMPAALFASVLLNVCLIVVALLRG
jgi:hypothetical protein